MAETSENPVVPTLTSDPVLNPPVAPAAKSKNSRLYKICGAIITVSLVITSGVRLLNMFGPKPLPGCADSGVTDPLETGVKNATKLDLKLSDFTNSGARDDNAATCTAIATIANGGGRAKITYAVTRDGTSNDFRFRVVKTEDIK